jgi:hypothetical protein
MSPGAPPIADDYFGARFQLSDALVKTRSPNNHSIQSLDDVADLQTGLSRSKPATGERLSNESRFRSYEYCSRASHVWIGRSCLKSVK